MTGRRPTAPRILATLTLAALVWALLAAAALAACRDDVVELRGPWGQTRFSVELAITREEQAQGLMFRESMPRSAGMLFLYDRPQTVAFWMRNTLISLDMLFFDDTGTLTRLHHEAVPLDETPIPGGAGVLAVLEINGGLSRRFGIAEGTQIRHPRLPQDRAAWPCD